MEHNIVGKAFFSLLFFVAVGAADVFRFEQIVEYETKKPLENDGVHWALLVAGSSGYFNYRHQADVCHAYQILHKHGIPDERIVVMMYDDIANNGLNPTPGIIINHPNGSDVYHDVPKDYTGKDVTPENFLNALQGIEFDFDPKKVIKSGPNDHIFVNLVDHGATNIFGFPMDVLHARDLIAALEKMYENKQFKQMVIYLEACESGSMLQDMPTNVNVYGTTASGPDESSYACYFDQKRDTYLGDVYSVMWMEDSDLEDFTVETLHKQYEIVKEETNTSGVHQYGDKSISKETLENFQGKVQTEPIVLPKAPLDAVRSEDVPLAIATRRIYSAKTGEQRAQAVLERDRILKERESIERLTMDILFRVTGDSNMATELRRTRSRLTEHDCYVAAVNHYNKYCYNLGKYDYAMRQMYTLANMCERQLDMKLILQSIYKACKN